MEFDRDGLRIIGVVALGHELQSVTGLELAQSQRTVMMLEPGDMEREQIARRLVHDGTPFKPAPRLANAAVFMAERYGPVRTKLEPRNPFGSCQHPTPDAMESRKGPQTLAATDFPRKIFSARPIGPLPAKEGSA